MTIKRDEAAAKHIKSAAAYNLTPKQLRELQVTGLIAALQLIERGGIEELAKTAMILTDSLNRDYNEDGSLNVETYALRDIH